jgi:hypothetical protein
VTHLLIPLYVMSDIRTIKRKVLGDIVSYREKLLLARRKVKAARGSVERPIASPSSEFNTARYLFTSWRVAALFPDLPESKMILQFQTPWPKKSFQREKKKVTKTYERKYSFLIQAMSRVVIFFLTSLLHLPLALQDMAIHMASNSCLGYLSLLMLRLSRVSPLLPLAPLFALLVIVHFWIRSESNGRVLELQESERDKTIHPLLDEEAGGVDVSGGGGKPRAILDPERDEPESGVNALTDHAGREIERDRREQEGVFAEAHQRVEVVVGEEKGAEIVLGNRQWTNVQKRQEEEQWQQDDADDGFASEVSAFWESSSDSSSLMSEDSAEGWLRRSPLGDLEANLGEDFWSQLSSSGDSESGLPEEESRPVVTV